MRAAIYTRISLDRTGASQSPERQEAECRQLCERRGWEVARVFSDRNLSAFKRDVVRPEYEAMLRAVERRDVDVVVVYSLSRLARSTRELVRVIDLLDKTGGTLTAVADSIDTSTATGRAMTQIVGVFAQLEADQTRERVMSGHRQTARLGKMHGGGSRRFGYTRQMEIIPEEAEVVLEIVGRAMAGESFWSLATDLNERGVRTTTGGQWYARTVKQMVTAPHVAGIRVHEVWAGKGPDRRLESRDVYDGEWEPIITKDEHAALLEAVTRTPAARRSVRRHLLTGLAICAVCEQAMKTTGFRMKNDQTFERYACVKQPGYANCGKVAVAKDSLDALVARQVLDYVARASMETGENVAAQIADLEQRMAEDDRSLTELTMARFVQRTLPPAAFEAAQAELNQRRSETEARLAELRRTEADKAGALRPGDRDALQTWWDEANLDDRRAALRAALHKVVVNPAKHRGGNRFDESRVELVWRLDFYGRASKSRWAAMTEEQRQAAQATYQAEVDTETERDWTAEDAEA